MTYPNAVFSAFAFLGFLMCAIPFPWHLYSWNIGTCLYMAWTGLACLFQFINSIIWNGNAINWSPIWCDISAKFIIGTSWAIPAASLCINRRLYYISLATNQSLAITKSEKLRGILVDLAIGLGLPIIAMILHYIPQGHRFNIIEDVGCFPSTYNTPVAVALVFCPPILIGLVSATYSILSFKAFNRRRLKHNDLFAYSNLTSSRYIRLMCLAGIEVLCTVPLASLSVYLNTKVGIRPWISWENTHFDFSRVDQFPALLWRADHITSISLELSRWLIVLCAFAFFAFFGFSHEARNNYRSAFETVAKHLGFFTSPPNSDQLVFAPSQSSSNAVSFVHTSILLSHNQTISAVDSSNDHDEKSEVSQAEKDAVV